MRIRIVFITLYLLLFILQISGIEYPGLKNPVYSENKIKDTIAPVRFSGVTANIFNEPVDSVKITVSLENMTKIIYSDNEGNFDIEFLTDQDYIGKSILIKFYKQDYKSFDTTFAYSGYTNLIISLVPRYKILLKGRIFIANSPLEGVNVTVSHSKDIQHLTTLGCYYDDENFWNCLYLGMFKTEVISDNPEEDSINLTFSKSGFKTQYHNLKFSDYSGDVLKFKMHYADSIPCLPNNNLALRISYPFGKNSGWYFNLSFYHRLNKVNFSRFAGGLEFSSLTYKKSTAVSTLPGLEPAYFDSTYVSLFIGPSALFYISKPNTRLFSTYIGSSFSINLADKQFVFQPFAGTRFFMDLRKSISVEVRYINYSLDIRNYTFNYLGYAFPSTKSISVHKLLINAGIQINF